MKERLEWVDGLRGIAVGIVVVYHTWLAWFAAQTGEAGVSLFFVLSGLCLSLGPLRARERGQSNWLDLARYARARCRRILPPYYVALGLFTGLSLWFASNGLNWPGGGGQPTDVAAILTHLALVQNLDPTRLFAIDGPMWSLATEAQWYMVFPLLLLAYLRWPRRVLAGCLVVSIAWSFVPIGYTPWEGGAFVLGRLAEFVAGIAAGYAFVYQRFPPRYLCLTTGLIGAVAMWRWPLQLWTLHATYAVSGITFAALILASMQSRRARQVLSRRPLVQIGVMSYSIYLIHSPIVLLSQPLQTTLPRQIVFGGSSLILALAASAGFYWSVERPLLRRRVSRRSEVPVPRGATA